jgi:hypothetical protein
MTKQRPRRARVLTNVRVDEISAVAEGAARGAKIMMRKRDSRPDYEAFFGRIFGVKKDTTFGGYPPTPGMRKNLDVHDDPDGPINPGGAEPDDDDDADYTEHLSDDADAGDDDEDDEPTNNDGADPEGAPTKHLDDLVEQLDKQQKDNAMKKLKSLDAVRVCKAMAADGNAYGTSEHDLVDWLDRYAKAHDTTFVKLYERNDDVGLAIRKAVDIAKNAQFLSRTSTLSKAASSSLTPMQVGVSRIESDDDLQSALDEINALRDKIRAELGYRTNKAATLRPRVVGGLAAQNVNNPRSALDQLNALAAEQRRNDKTLSESGAFARVYEDPKNADLAARERAESRPTAGW